MDNLALHHYRGLEVLEEYLADMGIELIFTPTYSADLNPVKLCFNILICLLYRRLEDTPNENLKIAVGEAVSIRDARNYFSATSHLFPTV